MDHTGYIIAGLLFTALIVGTIVLIIKKEQDLND